CSIPVVSAVGHEIDFTISDFAADVRAPTPSAAAELVAPDAAELKGNVASLAGALQRVLENRLRHSLTVLTSARRALMPRDAERALREPIQNLDRLRQDLTNTADDQMHVRRVRLREVVSLCAAYHPANVIDQKSERLDHTCSQIERAVQSAQQQALERLRHLQSMMRTLGPEATFARGFSITTNADGDIVRRSADLKKGDVLETRLASGKVVSTVSKTKK
ncbi:MAG TPA: exodeoxyribonuclease VII large subunit, partial [Verrucomicrobiales bacterium]|nr:exodeoxyribonuclease VII large subunit [Verrucomicrobiales bacterium]